jgi:SSS family solute:Na+ symporter
MDLYVIIPFVAYFLIVIGIGIYSTKFSSKGVSEFFLGGREMNRFVVALSAVVSGRSAWLLLGFTGLAYMVGYSAIWTALGYIIVEYLLFIYYAPKIRDYSEKHDCITVPDFYASRFGDKNGMLRLLLVIIFLIFMVTYVAAQFVAGGKAFSGYFDMTLIEGLVLTAVIVLIYTVMGGFLAVSLTDVMQAIFMIIVLVLLPIIGIIEFGGWELIHEKLVDLPQINKSGEALPDAMGKMFDPFSLSLMGAVGALGIGLGSPGSPHIIVRYMSIKDPKQFKWTAYVGTFWNVFMAAGALFIGIVGRAYFNSVSELPLADVENVYIHLANQLLPGFLVGLLLASIFAAIMSTADSQLLVAASSVVRDVYQMIIKRDAALSQKKLANMSRWVVLILVVLAVILGIYVQGLVFWFVLFAWAGLGAAIGPTSILALFWKKTTRAGVIAGMIGGTLTVFFWKLYFSDVIYELIPGFVVALILTLVVSLFTQKQNKY